MLSRMNLKAILGIKVVDTDEELDKMVLDLVTNTDSLLDFRIMVTSFEQVERYLEVLGKTKILRVQISCFTLLKPSVEFLKKIKQHLRDNSYREYRFSFYNHLKGFELKSHPFLELDL